MALSTNTYTYAGGAQTFVVNFALGFIQRSDVKVRVNLAVDGSGDPVYTAFTWTDDSNIVVTPTLTIGDSVQLERTVSKTELKVNFAATSDVTPANLDLSAKHGLMVYQELVDGRVDGAESPATAADRSTLEAAASAASAAAALVSEGLADIDAIATAADAVATAADRVQTDLDRITVSSALVLTNQDTIDTAADRVAVAADLVLTNQDTIDTNADRIAVAADLVATNQDTIDTAADAVSTAADAASALVSLDTARSFLPQANMQRVSQQVDVGFVGDHGDTELFSGAGNAHQDFDIVTVSGIKKLFMIHKVSGSTYATNERVRITESNYLDDGTAVVPVAVSTVLNLGHGQGFTAVVTGSTVTFYTSRKTVTSGNAGKGFAKVTWRGALTDDTDVVDFQILGDASSGHRYEDYSNSTACVSTDTDNSFLVMRTEVAGKLGHANKVLVYDRAEVEAAADPLLISPLSEFTESVLPYEDSHICQGIACDGVSVLLCYGYIAPEHVKYITKLSMSGSLLETKFASGMMDNYGPSGVRNNASKGVAVRMEHEGICVREGKTYLGFVTGFMDDTPIVTATINGVSVNLGAIGTTVGGTQDNPYSHRRWTRTDLAATAGAWDAATTYTFGTNWTEKNKYIIEVGDEDARSGWFGNTTDWYSMHDSPIGAADASADLSFPAHQAFNVNAHVALGGSQGFTRKALTLTDGELRLHDHRYESDDDLYAVIQREATAAVKRMVLEAQSGARINLYDQDAPTNAGIMQLLARDGVDAGLVTVYPNDKVTSTHGFQITPDQHFMADDEVLFIPVPIVAGVNLYTWKFSIIMQQSGANSGAWGSFYADTDGGPNVVNMSVGTNIISSASSSFNSGSAPTVGSYTDGKLSVVVCVGGVYLINRLNNSKNFGVTWSA